MVGHSFLWEGEGGKKPLFFAIGAPSASDKEIYLQAVMLVMLGVLLNQYFKCRMAEWTEMAIYGQVWF